MKYRTVQKDGNKLERKWLDSKYPDTWARNIEYLDYPTIHYPYERIRNFYSTSTHIAV